LENKRFYHFILTFFHINAAGQPVLFLLKLFRVYGLWSGVNGSMRFTKKERECFIIIPA
jgi:hypothetical protein